MNKQEFSERLSSLRLKKGVSARDMSLSIGQSAGYINNIENGINYPSMQVFFYICDYLDITPKEFFDTETVNPNKISELVGAVKGLNDRIKIMAVKSLSIRIDEEMLNKLHVVADYEGRSANSQILILIRDAIEKYEEKHGKIEL